jgi:hypothetical protein
MSVSPLPPRYDDVVMAYDCAAAGEAPRANEMTVAMLR